MDTFTLDAFTMDDWDDDLRDAMDAFSTDNWDDETLVMRWTGRTAKLMRIR